MISVLGVRREEGLRVQKGNVRVSGAGMNRLQAEIDPS